MSVYSSWNLTNSRPLDTLPLGGVCCAGLETKSEKFIFQIDSCPLRETCPLREDRILTSRHLHKRKKQKVLLGAYVTLQSYRRPQPTMRSGSPFLSSPRRIATALLSHRVEIEPLYRSSGTQLVERNAPQVLLETQKVSE